MIALGIMAVVLLALCGAPLFTVILAATMLCYVIADIGFVVISTEILRLSNTPLLVSLPLFTFAGYMLAGSNTSKRFMELVTSLFGWMPAGLAVVGFVVCAAFTALTGASGVTIVALGAILYPMLVRSGYSEKFSLGHVTASGSLGLLLVPSVPLILYGIVAQQLNVGEEFAIQELFIAGLLPAALMIMALSAYAMLSESKAAMSKFDSKRVWKAMLACKWEIPLPLLVIAGIYSGLFAVSEVAAFTALYVLLVEVFVYKEISIKALPKVIQDSMIMVGSIILILGTALALTNYFVDAQIASQLFSVINEQISNPLIFLILLNVVLLILGAFLDIFSATVIMVPLLLPVAAGYGIHPVHLGIIFIANLQIGYFTPPIGMNLFIASYRFKRSVLDLYAASLPFMGVLLIVLLLVTYVPFFSMWYKHF